MIAEPITQFGDSDASYTHACEVSHHPQVEPIILWCKQNLDDTWRWQIVETSGNSPGRYIFYFNNEKNYLAFLLRWK